MTARVRVAVVGARGRLGACACAALRGSAAHELVGELDRDDDWPRLLESLGATVALDATAAGLGARHGTAMLERGVRPVIGTSGVSVAQNDALDALARARGLGGIVVPNFSLGAVLVQRVAVELARHFADVEIVELHHERKRDAPSGTAAETARRIAAERGASVGSDAGSGAARGELVEGVRVHSVRLPGLYAHQEILLGAPGELITLRHDMLGPEAFARGILAAIDYAATARGVARGLEVALAVNP